MKYIVQIVEVVIIILIVTLSVYAYNQVEGINIMKSNAAIERRYHMALVTDTGESYGTEAFLEGIQGVLKDYDTVMETYDAQSTAIADIVDMLLLTKVDGVVLKLEQNQLAESAIETLEKAGIYVVTVGNDAPNSGRDVYIGTNKYNMGKQAARLAVKTLTPSRPDVALILGAEYDQEAISLPNNFIGGVFDVVSEKDTQSVAYIGYSRLSRAEIIMDDIIRNMPNVGAVICTDPVDAVRISRVLVDQNRVGVIKIIASGHTEDIQTALDDGVISATLVEDYQELGRMAVSYLSDLLNQKEITSYVNIPIEIIEGNTP